MSQHRTNVTIPERAAGPPGSQGDYRSDLLLQAIVDGALDSIVVTDPEGHFLEVNPAFCTLVGVPRDQLLGGRYADFAPAGFDVGGFRRRFLDAGQDRGNLTVIRPDGGVRLVEYAIRARVVDDRNVAILRDITCRVEAQRELDSERRRLEQQFVEAQKMEAIGLLAGGVAHDFNNMLAAIQGFATVVLGDLRETDPLRGDVKEILAASTRAADLTRQLLAVSRRQPMDIQALDPCEVLCGLARMLERVLGEDVRLTIRCPSDKATIRADPAHLEQIILNLAVNARDAMPGGGALSIEVDCVLAAPADAPAGEYVRLQVTDTGTGMDEATCRRVFEPFFTTKATGRGTGLGLSTVYGIVGQLGGHIAIDSEPGRGTRFIIHLPRRSEEPLAHPPVPDRTDSLRGTESLLVVEDEGLVRRMIAQILGRQGYRVHLAADAGEALLIVEDTPIDLVVTDVVLPRLGGFELVARLRALQPRLPALYVTGYMEGGAPPPAAAAEVLTKPFQPAELLRRVRRLLG